MTVKKFPAGVSAPSASYPWPHVSLDVPKMITLEQSCRSAGIRYGLGSKAPSLSAKPGSFTRIDCSGFVRWVVYQAAGVTMPDGSVNQRDWIENNGFKRSDVDSGALLDGAVRIAFLSPQDGGGIGHVVLIHGGQTCESHGGVGPDRRPWTGAGWQRHAHVFVLCPPAS